MRDHDAKVASCVLCDHAMVRGRSDWWEVRRVLAVIMAGLAAFFIITGANGFATENVESVGKFIGMSIGPTLGAGLLWWAIAIFLATRHGQRCVNCRHFIPRDELVRR